MDSNASLNMTRSSLGLYKWSSTYANLWLKPYDIRGTADVHKIITMLEFVKHWANFRDLLPLRPDKLPTFAADTDEESMDTFITAISSMIYKPWSCKYDSISLDERQDWDNEDHFTF